MNKIKRILNQYSYKYLKTFSKEDFLRYQEMLMLTSREQLGESYLLKEKWWSDIVNIREIRWQDVTEHTLDTSSTYTKEWIKKVIRGIWLFCVWSCKKLLLSWDFTRIKILLHQISGTCDLNIDFAFQGGNFCVHGIFLVI